MNRARSILDAHRRAGLTLLEVVISCFTLALATGVIIGGIGFMRGMADRNRLRLDAMEVAHRVVLQHIDDDAALRSQVKRIELNGDYFAYTLNEQVMIDESTDTKGSSSKHTLTGKQIGETDLNEWLISKIYLVQVKVFADNDHTGAAGKTPLAELTRLYNWTRIDDQTMFKKLTNSMDVRRAMENQNLSGNGPGVALPAPTSGPAGKGAGSNAVKGGNRPGAGGGR